MNSHNYDTSILHCCKIIKSMLGFWSDTRRSSRITSGIFFHQWVIEVPSIGGHFITTSRGAVCTYAGASGRPSSRSMIKTRHSNPISFNSPTMKDTNKLEVDKNPSTQLPSFGAPNTGALRRWLGVTKRKQLLVFFHAFSSYLRKLDLFQGGIQRSGGFSFFVIKISLQITYSKYCYVINVISSS